MPENKKAINFSLGLTKFGGRKWEQEIQSALMLKVLEAVVGNVAGFNSVEFNAAEFRLAIVARN